MGTKKHGSKSRVYIGGYDASGAMNAFGVTMNQDAAESSTFDELDKSYIAGMKSHSFTTGGVYLLGTNEAEQVIATSIGAGTIEDISCAIGTTRGDRAYGCEAFATSDSIVSSVGGIVTQSDSWQANNMIVGDLLAPPATITATGSQVGVSYSLGAFALGNTIGAMFHLLAYAGTGNITFEIEHSTDSTTGSDGTWASIGAGLTSGAMSATGVVRATIPAGGVIGPWLRVTATKDAGVTSVSLLCHAGLVV